jgi:hypothetical protein
VENGEEPGMHSIVEGTLFALGRYVKSFGGRGGGENKLWWVVVPVANGANGQQLPSKEENKLSKSSISLEMIDGGCLMLAISDFML